MKSTIYDVNPEYSWELAKGKMKHLQGILESETRFPFVPQQEFWGLLFNLENRINYTIDDEPGIIPKGHFNMVYLPVGGCDLILQKGSYELFCLEFNPAYLKMIYTNFPVLDEFFQQAGGRTPILMCEPHPEITIEILYSIYGVIRNDSKERKLDMYLNSKFIDLFIKSLERCQHFVRGLDEDDISRIRAAKEYIEQNLKFQMEVGYLADKVLMSRRKFESGFKRLYGTSVFDFITNERMKKAVALLRDTTLTLTEISASIGYTNLNSFYKTFKRRFGQAPGELRKTEDE